MSVSGINRRNVMQAMAACSVLGTPLRGLAASAPLPSRPLDLAKRTPQDDLLLWAKLKADLAGRTLYSITTGTVWGFRPQADDLTLADFAKRLYGYATCVARRGTTTTDGKISFRTRSWNFYLDPESNVFTQQLFNPYTGKTVTSAPMIAPAREQQYSIDGPLETASIPLETRKPPRPFDLQVRVIGDRAFVNESNFIRFKPNDITWHKLEATLWSHSCLVRELVDTTLTHIPSTWTQNLVAEWQTWMNMHGSPGHILFKGDGCHVPTIEQIPDDLRRNIETVTPGGLAETASWS